MKPKDTSSKGKLKQDNKKVSIIQFLNIADNSLHSKCSVSVDEPIFQPEPNIILFEDYEPLQILTKTLKLKNRDTVPRHVSIIHPENRLFQVYPNIKSKNGIRQKQGESANTKVAPGMEVSYSIKFTPESKSDINYDLVVITEREKFIVPIRGIGCKVNLEYTDYIDFGEVPVKYKIEKPFIIRNVGEKITKWMLKCVSSSVTISKKEGILDTAKNEQIICTFCPEKEKNYKESMILTYDETDHIINIYGKSKNDAVDISPKILEMEPAYITLHTEKTVTITNDTGVPIEYVWKQFESKEKEEEAKQKVFQNLSKQEQEEKILNELQHTYEENPYEDDTSIDLEDSYDEDEIIRMNERNHLKNQNIIARRFEKIKKSLNEDQMCFEHPNFVIETLTGKVWPNTKATITVTFRPEEAKDYKDIFAYLDVTGSEKRIKLELRGRGIGPKARVNNPEFNLYDIPITHQIQLEPKLVIYNIGVIPCEFFVEMPGTPCSQQFHFENEHGIIPPRDEKSTGEQVIPITFKASRLGEFSEKFNIKIGKSKDVIPIIFKGHVIAPYCRFSVERIDFEKVSIGFDKVETVVLYNESDVDIEFRLRIATDSQDNDKAMETVFEISPKEGRVERKQSKEIQITFRPDKERPYDIVVLLDMLGIGFDMLTLPVSGICEVPEVEIEPMELLDFGNVYIRQEVTQTIKLHNTSNLLSTQFKINKQDEPSKAWGELTCDQQSGQIGPEQTIILTVKLKPLRLQQIRLKLEIDCKTKGYNARESGNNYITAINVIATSRGPDVVVVHDNIPLPQAKDSKAIKQLQSMENNVDFGIVKTLNEKVQTIKLANVSPIDAIYTAFMKTPGSIFYVKNPKDRIKAGETKVVEISCKPDEQQKFYETLYFKIEESDGFEVNLKANGEGTTIVPEFDLKEIDFGTVFTCTDVEKNINFENRGRSDQYISFVSKKPKKKPMEEKEQNKKKKKEEDDEVEVFRFYKDCPKRTLPSRKYGSMTLIANSRKAGILTANYGVHCYKTSDNNGPEIWDVTFKAEFIDPQLQFSPPKLFYTYKNDEDSDKETIYKMLTITNVAKLPADFTVKSEAPFSISKDKFLIEPGKSEQLRVDFDPSANKKKKRIESFEGKLIFKHNNHEKVEELKMTVQINFPNIKNLPNELYFGCLLNDTFTKKTIKLERDTASDLDVLYEWELIELENSYESLRRGRTITRKIPLNEVFSIVPMNGRLRKGELESEEVTITFTPGPNQRYTAIARCLVDGGPQYDLKLIGEASEIKYKLQVNEDIYDSSKKEFSIKFGEIPFNTTTKVDLFIKNEGEVPFDYRITYHTDKLRFLALSNAIDSVNKGESKKITIEIIPGVPDKMDDEIIVEIAHFEPHVIKIKAVGYYPGIILGQPLERKEENYKELFEQTKNDYISRRKALDDYFPKTKQNIKKNVLTISNINELNNSNITNDSIYEFDVNRSLLCEKIVDRMNKGEISNNLEQPQKPTSIFSLPKKPEKNLKVNSSAYRENQLLNYLKDLVIAEYHVSFGNVVANHKASVSFTVTNLNKGQIQLLVDKKDMAAKGYTITNGSGNDKCFIDEGKSCNFTVTHNTSSQNANIDINNILKLQMSNGECYLVYLHSYVSIPSLSLSTNLLDMNRVYIGHKKIMNFRIENTARVDCSWTVSFKDMTNKKEGREEKKENISAFDITPKEGKLTPGKKLTLTCTFTPIRRKKYQGRFVFNITDNQKNAECFIKGNAEVLELIINPETVNIGPILPYWKYGLAPIEIKNPNDSEIEVYSSDFDKKFIEEENILKFNKLFIKNPDEKIDIKIRNAGEAMWKKFDDFNIKLNEKIEEFKKFVEEYLTSVEMNFDTLFTDQFKEKLSMYIQQDDDEKVKLPPAIEKKDKVNIVLIGPKESGKTSILKQQMKTQFRGIISLKDLLKWNLENGHPEYEEKIAQENEEKKKEYDDLKAQYDKLAKQAKSNKKIVLPDPPSESMYKCVSKTMFAELLNNRLSEGDCRIGCVFDDIECDLLESPEMALEYLDDFFVDENLILAYFDFPKDKDGLDVCHYIDWTNYIEDLSGHRKIKKDGTARGTGINNNNVNVNASATMKNNNNNVKKNENVDNLNKTVPNKRRGKNDKNKKEPEIKVEEPQIPPEITAKFKEMFDDFCKNHITLKTVANSEPKELTPEEKEEYLNLVERMKKKMEDLLDRRLNPPKEEPEEQEEEEEKKNNKKDDKKKKTIRDNKKEEEDKKKAEEEEKKKAEEEEKKKAEEEEKKEVQLDENGNPIENPEQQQQQIEQPPIEEKFNKERKCIPITFEYCIPQLLQSYLKSIPNPILPDPEELPIPPDEEVQIIRKPQERTKHEMLENFFLKGIDEKYKDLPFEELIEKIKEEDKKLEELKKQKEEEAKDPKKKKAAEAAAAKNKKKEGEVVEEEKPEIILTDQTRWVIPPNGSVKAVVGFFAKEVCTKTQDFLFEIMTYPPVEYKMTINGQSDYPSMTTITTRPKQGNINLRGLNKKYEDDFGYILITNDPEREVEKYKATNCKTLRFTNNGKFDIVVDFAFLSSMNFEGLNFKLPFVPGQSTDPNFEANVDPKAAAAAKKKDPKKDNKNVQDEGKTPFFLPKNQIEIKMGQTAELDVYAFPLKQTEYKDELICMMKDNPIPTRVLLTCKGAEPNVVIDTDSLDFEKLVVNQPRTKYLKMNNISEVNCKWALNGIETLPPVYKIEPTSGVIEKGKEQLIAVTFVSEEQDKYPFQFNLDIEDNLGYGVKMETKVIKLMAEAFKVTVELVIDNEGKIIDFGNVKVKEPKHFPFVLKNLGIYKIRYKFEIMKKLWQELFRFEPVEGEIEPGKDRTIFAIFNRYKKDINISPQRNSSEIKLSIFEGEKGTKNQDINIFVNVASYFSKYSINPPKSLNFGSLQYNESQTRSIEIRNEGQFDFNYEIFEYLQDINKMIAIKEEKEAKEIEEYKAKEQEIKDALEGVKGKKDNKKQAKPPDNKKGGKGKEEDALVIGKYKILNYKGTIAPGSAAKIDVIFTAEGQQFCSANLAIDIQGRQSEDNPLGIPFDLVAESCIPGIETQDFDSIFEEQTVLPSISPDLNKQTVITSGIYGIEEKVFWFGTIIASKNPNGVSERFKLINNNKIPCIVHVSVKPRTASKSEGFAFEVQCQDPLKIYPGESEYVTVTFKPTNVMPYSGLFEATVEGGTDKTGNLKFELRGEGTLPTLLLESPNEYDADGTPILKFKKLRLNKSIVNQIVLKNEGVVAATVQFEPLQSDCFSFESSTKATIPPKKYQAFDIKFTPKAEKVEKAVLQYKTLFNPYEIPRLLIQGEGFFEPVSIEGLVNENELTFGDVCINTEKSITFTLINNSDNNFRFNMINNLEPSLIFTPNTGFILHKTQKEITVKFISNETVKHILKDLFIELKEFKFKEDQNENDWDETMTTIKKVTQKEQEELNNKKKEDQQRRKDENEALIGVLTNVKGSKMPAPKKDAKKDPKKDAKNANVPVQNVEEEEANIDYEEIIPEPEVNIIDKSEKYLPIKLTVISDYAKYECNIKEIRFKPTVMYGTRKFDFHLRNTSLTSLNYNFTLTNPNPNSTVYNNLLTSYDKTLMPENNDTAPYTISPQNGNIPPQSDEVITITFSPLEIDDFNFKRILKCNIKDLDPNLKELSIELSGDAERPICHFEMVGGVKREGGMTILQFESIGMMIKNTVRFFALNPTNQGYNFEWEQPDEDLIPNINKVFKCLTPKGVIYSGKKYEMVFTYTPNSLGKHEAFFNFKIPSENQIHKFALHGITREPMILFNVGKVTFDPLLLGGRQKETIEIRNEEHIPYKFTFDKDSIKGNVQYGDSLFVTPIAGTLPAKSSTKVDITFMPRVEKEFNYNLQLKVKQRLKPLTLNVKGVGYTINHGVYLDNKPEMKLLRKGEHVIDFGDFFINDKRERSIRIENGGKFNFHFSFKKNGADYLKITPDSGTVTKGSKLNVTLTLFPLNKINLQNHKIFLNIASGPTYTFLINAKARSPQIIFSSIKCDFGPCYVMRQPVPNTQIITVKNMDKEALTIETDFDNKNKQYLDVFLSTGQVILPYQSQNDILEIPIQFIPRDYVKYKDIIKFKFNDIYNVDVEITGEGIPLKVELEDPSLNTLNFNIVKLGKQKKMSFNVINRGKMMTTVELYPETPNTFLKRCLSIKTDFVNDHPDEATKPLIHVLKPKEMFKIEVLFNPNLRIPQFTEDLMMKINNSEKKRLLGITGASYGVDVKMMGEIPSFGVVTVNSNAMRTITLRNFGDIPAIFNWNLVDNKKRNYTKWFTITPTKGNIPPHEDIKINIIFHPKQVSNLVQFEHIKCDIEEFDTPIDLSLYGKSIAVPAEAITEKRLETQVRVPATYEIKIKNTSDKQWRITPSISSSVKQYVNYFKGSESIFEINPGQEGTYVVTYCPLTMSKINPNDEKEKLKEHDASVFFPLPDGTAKIFKVIGTALPPSEQETINATAVVREWTTIKLNIQNWLLQKQRFKVTWPQPDQGVFIKGANTIDVPSNGLKEYKMSFRSLKDTPYNFKVTFENIDNKEYIFYMINVTMKAAEPLNTVELVGEIREIVTGSFTINNPLNIDVTINKEQVILENEYLSVSPETIVIPAESEVTCDVSFRPLIVGKIQSSITIKSSELGELKYPISIEGTPAMPKQLQPIEASLGSEKIIQISFIHYLKKAATYTIKVEKYADGVPFNDFVPEVASITVDPSKGGVPENTFNLRYEPSSVDGSKGLLKISSPDGGEYQYILTGKSSYPQAQGPFKVPPGKSLALEFKNPLNEAVEINVRFDNPNFSAGKVNNKLEAKKVMNIPIAYKVVNNDCGSTGRCIVTVNKLPPWVYYLTAEA